ncbi:MAG: helix-turn-helix domain-containing protein [Bacteroidota bacterium]
MSYHIKLSLDESYELADRMKVIKNKKQSRRLLALSLRHYGYKVKDIAPIIGTSEKTITQWMKLFAEGGFEGLLKMNYPERRGSKLAAYESAIQQKLIQNPHLKLADIQMWLKESHGLEVEYSWLYRYLERKGMLEKRKKSNQSKKD